MIKIFNLASLRIVGLMMMFAIFSYSCSKKGDLSPDASIEQESNLSLIQEARNWFDKSSSQMKSSSDNDFNLNSYNPDWKAFVIDTNLAGKSVISVPLLSKEIGASYTEMSIIIGKEGRASGIVKEYMNDPYKGESELRLYTNDGKLYATGTYRSDTKQMQLHKAFAKSFKAISKGNSANGGKLMWEAEVGEEVGGGGETPDSRWLDEVVITEPYTPPTTWEPEPHYDPPIDPGIPVDPAPIGGSGGGGGTTATAPPRDFSCASFVFTKTTGSFQEAGVKNIRIKVRDLQRNINRDIYMPTLVFGLPTFITPNQASTFASSSVNNAMDAVWGLYRASPTLPNDPVIQEKFIELLRGFLSVKGGTVQRLGPQTSAIVVVKEADYDLLGSGDCND